MGLDQYAIVYPPYKGNTDFKPAKDDGAQLLSQWRKHPNLQGWMTNLYNVRMRLQNQVGVTNAEHWGSGTFNIQAVPMGMGEDGPAELPEEIVKLNEKFQEHMAKIQQDIVGSVHEFADADDYVFNCDYIRLTESDLDQLEEAINRGELPPTTGFFFGDNADEHYKEQDLKFIADARIAMSMGFQVYYTSDW
jgi:hypothetical protein